MEPKSFRQARLYLREKRSRVARPGSHPPLFMPRVLPSSSSASRSGSSHLPMRVALWLLDSPRLGQTPGVKRIAGNLLKQPARKGCVQAQSRLGQLLCRDCGNTRDRRIGYELLRQAARAGDRSAQQELERLSR